MIKIAIDVSPLSDDNSTRGVGYYTQNLVNSLKTEIKKNPKYKKWQIDLVTKGPISNEKEYSLVHYPYFDPFQLTLPSKKTTPTIITIHDLIPRQFASHFPVGIKGELKWRLQKIKAKKSNFIITVSHYSKHIIKDILNFPEDRIYVTHLAADNNFRQIDDNQYLESIQKKYNLPKQFILYVGDLNWNKNIVRLVKVCQKLNYNLVIVGSAATRKNVIDHPWNQDILWLQKNKTDNIFFTGFVPDEDLAAIFNLAKFYCQPSLAEGFGLPVVQAMACGCPVAYSKETSLPEIMDYSGVFFNPYSQKDMSRVLKQFWNSAKSREKYKLLGLERSKIFNWKYTAQQTLAVYELALIDEK